jgi:hypothetical protein
VKQTFDALIHFIFEGSFLALSTFGRTVNASESVFAQMCTSRFIRGLPTFSSVFASLIAHAMLQKKNRNEN